MRSQPQGLAWAHGPARSGPLRPIRAAWLKAQIRADAGTIPATTTKDVIQNRVDDYGQRPSMPKEMQKDGGLEKDPDDPAAGAEGSSRRPPERVRPAACTPSPRPILRRALGALLVQPFHRRRPQCADDRRPVRSIRARSDRPNVFGQFNLLLGHFQLPSGDADLSRRRARSVHRRRSPSAARSASTKTSPAKSLSFTRWASTPATRRAT